MTEYRIDREHNNPYTKYVREGADTGGGAYNLESARLEAMGTEKIDVADSRASLEVTLPNPGNRLRMGMIVTLELNRIKLPAMLAIPLEAVVRYASDWFAAHLPALEEPP